MRTTLNLDDDISATVTRLARERGVSIGRAVSDLLRKGLRAPAAARKDGDLVVFDLPPDSPEVTMETVRALESEGPPR